MGQGKKEDQMTESGMRKSSSGCCKLLGILSLPCLGNCPISMVCVSINTLYVDREKLVLTDSPENCYAPNCNPLVLWELPSLAQILTILWVWVEKGIWVEQDYFDRPECRVCTAKQAGRNENLSWHIEKQRQEPFNQSINFDQSPNFCRQTKVKKYSQEVEITSP